MKRATQIALLLMLLLTLGLRSRALVVDEPPNAGNPTANAGPDQIVDDSDGSGAESVTIDGSNSTDQDGTISSYAWACTSGTPSTCATASCSVSFNVGGPFVCTLTVTDDSANTDQDTVSITVRANQPPVANAGPDQFLDDDDGSGDEDVTFDASSSFDPDGSIASYTWKSPAGCTTGVDCDIDETGANPTASAVAVGIYDVELTVTDNAGSTGTDTLKVTIDPQPGTSLSWLVDFEGSGCNAEVAGNSTPDVSGTVDCDATTAPLIEGAEYAVMGPGATADNWLRWINAPWSASDNVHYYTACFRPHFASGEDERSIFFGITDNGETERFLRLTDTQFRTNCNGTAGTLTNLPGGNNESYGIRVKIDPVTDQAITTTIWEDDTGDTDSDSCAFTSTANIDTFRWQVPNAAAWASTSIDLDNFLYSAGQDPGRPDCTEIGNAPPQAVLTVIPGTTVNDSDGDGSETLTFDGVNSSDDSAIQFYRFRSPAGSGTTFDVTVNPPSTSTSQSLSVAGSPHTVELIVTDDGSPPRSDSTQTTINVTSSSPVACFTVSQTQVATSGSVTVDGSCSTGPSLTYAWTAPSGAGCAGASFGSSSAVSTTFSGFSGTGSCTLQLAVSNGFGNDSVQKTITVTNSNVTANYAASSTSGDAPLYVHFNAETSTTSAWGCNSDDPTTCGPSSLGSRGGTTHHLLYAHDFDDASSGTWDQCADDDNGFLANFSRDRYFGAPWAGHVYESAATYNPQVTAYSGAGDSDSDSVTVTVSNPDTSGTYTTKECWRNSGRPTSGCPAGFTDNVGSGNGWCPSADNTLVRLEGGSTFTGTCSMNGRTDVLITKYGSGTPTVQAAASSAPVIEGDNTTRLKIWGLNIKRTSGDPTTCEALSNTACRWIWAENHTDLLVYDNDFSGFGYNNSSNSDGFGFICNRYLGGIDTVWRGRNGFNIDLDNGGAVMGNKFTPGGEHHIRTFGGDDALFTFNWFYKDPQALKTIAKINGEADNHGNSINPINGIVIGYNTLSGTTGGYGAFAAPGCKATSANCEIRDVIIEGNFDPEHTINGRSFRSSSERATIRHNISKGTEREQINTFTRGDTSLDHVADYMWAYGNTMYSTITLSGNRLCLKCNWNHCYAYNNFCWAPDSANNTATLLDGPWTDLGGNVLTEQASSPFTGSSPGSDVTDYRCSSSLCNQKGQTSTNQRPDYFGILNFNDGDGVVPDSGAFRDGTALQ